MLGLSASIHGQFVIKGDATWKVHPSYIPNWTSPDFDDSAWGTSIAPSPWVISPVVAGSQSMWIAPYSDTVYFRKSFELKGECIEADFTLSADNEFEFYINDQLVGIGQNLGLTFNFPNVESFFRIGMNTIAIKAVNWNNGPYLASIYGTVDYTSAPIIELTEDDTLCPDIPTDIRSLWTYNSYSWSNGENTQSITVDQSGKYWVEARDASNCLWVDTANIVYHAPMRPDLGPDRNICAGDTVMFILDGFDEYLWKSGQDVSTLVVGKTGQYTVSTTDSNDCVAADSVNIKVFDFATINLGDDVTRCKGDTVTIGSPFPRSVYRWSNGSTDEYIDVLTTGTYSVTVTNFCGSVSDAINVSFADLSEYELQEEIYLCRGLASEISAGAENASYEWSNGQTTESIMVVEPGTYTVAVRDVCGNEKIGEVIVHKPLDPEHLIPNSFTPNKDGRNETFGTQMKPGDSEYFWFRVFDQWGQTMFDTHDPLSHWDGSDAAVGTYTYQLWYQDCRDQRILHVGSVQLIR